MVGLRCIAELHGLQMDLPTGAPVRPRGSGSAGLPEWMRRVTLASPRGDVSRAGLAIHVHKSEDVADLTAELVRQETGQVLYRAPVDPGTGFTRMTIPHEVAARLEIGGTYCLCLRQKGAEGQLTSVFLLKAEAPPEEPLEDADPVHARMLRIARLLDAGYAAEAFAGVVELATEHPEQALPWRLGLAALERMALLQSPLYLELMGKYQEARDGGR